VEHQYLEISRRYRKALGQRSAWLREGHDGAFDKDPWAQDIAKQGAQINHRRKGFVASLDQQTRRIFAALGAELEVQLVYHGVGDTEDAVVAMAQLAESYERDLRHGTTHIGPHRNDVDIAVNGTNAKNIVSRGQAKLIASAIVLACCAELSQQSNVLPVLLLDDFGAELDSGHRERFFLELERIGCQVIATTTDEPKYLVGDALASRARVFHVEQGAISRYS
jgi:DNA replication and repair protein RecF